MILALLWLGCGAPATRAACEGAPDVTWDGWAHGFFVTYCTACHAADTRARAGAPVGLDFDDEGSVRTHADAIRAAVLDAETMPVGGGVYPADKTLLEVYLTCGVTSDGG